MTPTSMFRGPRAGTGSTPGTLSSAPLSFGLVLFLAWSFQGPAYATLQVQRQPTNQTVVVGSRVVIEASVLASTKAKFVQIPTAIWYRVTDAGTNSVDLGPNAPMLKPPLYQLEIPSVQTNHAGRYYLYLEVDRDWVATTQALLTVVVPPGFVRHPQSQSATVGGQVRFEAEVSGTQPMDYQWFKDGNRLPGATNAFHVITNVQTNHAGVYTLRAANFGGSTNSQPAGLAVVWPPPVITRQPLNQVVSLGGSAQFSVGVASTTPFTCQWRRNGVDIQGATSENYILDGVRAEHAASYSVQVRNEGGATNSANALLTVLWAQLEITDTQDKGDDRLAVFPNTWVAESSTNITFRIHNAGTGPLMIRRLRLGEPVSQFERSAEYRFTLRNTAGEVVTANDFEVAAGDTWRVEAAFAPQAAGFCGGYLTFDHNDPNPAWQSKADLFLMGTAREPAPIITRHPQSLTSNVGTEAAFTVEAASRTPVGYQWRKNGVSLPGANSPTYLIPSVRVSDAGNYSVIVSNEGGASPSEIAALTVLWGQLRITDNSGVTDDRMAQFPDTRVRQSSTNVTFLLQNSGVGSLGISRLRLGEPVTRFTRSAEYRYTLRDASGEAVSATNFLVGAGQTWRLEVVFAPQAAGYCGGYLTFDHNDPTTGWQGKADLFLTGTATEVIDPPVILAHPQSRTNFLGEQARFEVLATSTVSTTFQWFKDGLELPGATNWSLTIANVRAVDDGIYTVMVRNAGGSAPGGPARLTVQWAELKITDNQGISEDRMAFFPNTRARQASTNIVFRLYNAGTGPLHVRQFHLGEPIPQFERSAEYQFTLRDPAGAAVATPDFTVAPGLAWQVEVAFAPKAAGYCGGYLTFNHNDPNPGWRGKADLFLMGTATEQPPILLEQPRGLTNMVGEEARFSVGVENPASVTYQWRKDGTNLLWATGSSYSISNLQPGHAGNYDVILSNAGGSVPSQQVPLVVQWATLRITDSHATPQDRMASFPDTWVGESTTNILFQIHNGGTGPLTVRSPRLGEPVARFERSADYRFTLRNGAGQLASNGDFTVAVGETWTIEASFVPQAAGYCGGYITFNHNDLNPAWQGKADLFLMGMAAERLPAITAQPESRVATVGEAVSFVVAATSRTLPTYQWLKDGLALPGETAATLTITNVQTAHAGRYSVMVRNLGGSVTSESAQLAVETLERTFVTLAGTSGGGGAVDGVASTAKFNQPSAVAVDGSGAILVADAGNHVIRRLDPSGKVGTLAGWAGRSGSADGKGSMARFYGPRGLAMDRANNLFVADGNNHTIRKITPQRLVTTLAGQPGKVGHEDAPGSGASFFKPYGLAVGLDGEIIVADEENHTIRKITPAGLVMTVAGSPGLSGTNDGVASAARFSYPSGVAVGAGGEIYVADQMNYTIRRISQAGQVITLAGSARDRGALDGANARFMRPSSLALGKDGRLWVSDGLNRIRSVNSDRTVSSLRWQPAEVVSPAGLACDRDGSLVVADAVSCIIRAITLQGALSTLAGSHSDAGSADGAGTLARFDYPEGIAVDANGNVYVTETGNHTLRKITPDGAVTTIAGKAGEDDHVDGPGETARFAWPIGVAVDRTGTIFVASSRTHTIRKITPAGQVTTFAGLPNESGSQDGMGAEARFAWPAGLAIDTSGNLLVADADNMTIRRVSPAGQVSTLAGSPGLLGSEDGTGSAARFGYPSGIAVGPADFVYVADLMNQTIRRITPAGEVTTLAGAVGEVGRDDGVGASARFAYPSGVAVGLDGSIFVADAGNAAIRRVSPEGEVTTVAGSPGEIGNADGVGSAVRFSWPAAVAVTKDGRLLIADTENNRVCAERPAISTRPVIDLPAAPTGQTRHLGVSGQPAVAWNWEVVRRPAGAAAELVPPDGASPLFLPDVPDLYVFRLTATNAAGALSIRTVEFMALPEAPEILSWTHSRAQLQFQVSFTSVPGVAYRLDSAIWSANKLNWTTNVASVTASDTTTTLRDTTLKSNTSYRFYRVVRE